MKWQTQELYFRMLIARQLQIPIPGQIFFVFPAGSSTSKYEDWIEHELDIPSELKFQGATALHDAYANATAYRNDVICVFPGAYDIDTELNWSKAQTHLVGLGGPAIGGDYSEPNVCIYSDNIATDSIITCTGPNSQFHNAVIWQAGNNAACLTAFTLNTYHCYFKNMGFKGVATAGVDDVVAAASLYIGQSAFGPVFEDCIIGQNEWDVREGANSGHLRFVGTTAGAPSNGVFRRCRFLSVSNTATVALVAVPSVDFCGRGWLMDNCFFYNESSNQTSLNRAFYMNTSGSDNIPVFTLHHCVAAGITEWYTDDNDSIVADMPITGTGGGIARSATGTAGN